MCGVDRGLVSLALLSPTVTTCPAGTQRCGADCEDCVGSTFGPCQHVNDGTCVAFTGSPALPVCPSGTTQCGLQPPAASQCDGCIENYYRDPKVKDESKWCRICPENAYCAGDSVEGTTLLPVPHAGFWSNRSDLALVHYIHACPRGEEVCTGGLANTSDVAGEEQTAVALKECWLPENLMSDACTDDAILWCVCVVLWVAHGTDFF